MAFEQPDLPGSNGKDDYEFSHPDVHIPQTDFRSLLHTIDRKLDQLTEQVESLHLGVSWQNSGTKRPSLGTHEPVPHLVGSSNSGRDRSGSTSKVTPTGSGSSVGGGGGATVTKAKTKPLTKMKGKTQGDLSTSAGNSPVTAGERAAATAAASSTALGEGSSREARVKVDGPTVAAQILPSTTSAEASKNEATKTDVVSPRSPTVSSLWAKAPVQDEPNDAGQILAAKQGLFGSSYRPSQLALLLARTGLHQSLEEMEEVINDLVEAAEERAKDRPLVAFVRSSLFHAFVSAAILLNALFLGYRAGVSIDEVARGTSAPGWLLAVSLIFSLFFVAELLLRAWAERVLFCFGEEWRWNLFDVVVVGLSLIDSIMECTAAGNSNHGQSMPGITIGRMLRLARFFRLIQVARVLKYASSLRLVVFTILDSMVSLIWCIVVVSLVIYTFAVLLVYGAAEHLQDTGLSAQQVQVNHAELLELYGGITEAMLSLFMAVSGGADWRDVMSPLKSINGIYVPIFVFYICFMFFGVLNVVIGAFISNVGDVAAKDREEVVKSELTRLAEYTARIKTFFKEADVDKSGTLSWEEFRGHLNHSKVKAYFQSLDLDVAQAHILFELLDADNSDNVTVDEFLDGCVRLKGQAKSIDMNMLVFMCQKLFGMLQEHIASTHGEFRKLRVSLTEKNLGAGSTDRKSPASKFDAQETASPASSSSAAAAAAAAIAAVPKLPLSTSDPKGSSPLPVEYMIREGLDSSATGQPSSSHN